MIRVEVLSTNVRVMRVLCPECNSGRLCDLIIGDNGEVKMEKGKQFVIKCPKCKESIGITV